MIRVLIVDDDVSLRQLLAFMLEREPEFQLVAEVGTLAEARRVLQDADIAIVDMMLPDGSGADLVGELRAANPGCRVLVLTSVVNRVLLARAMQAGAAGIVQKSARIGEIVDALRQLDRGEQLLSPAEASELQRLVDEPQE
ncbi:MAG: response regulator transcription factor [Chloroflexota bacterium]|nr:response regulator transcription factor [Chloroflexota bacterium]